MRVVLPNILSMAYESRPIIIPGLSLLLFLRHYRELDHPADKDIRLPYLEADTIEIDLRLGLLSLKDLQEPDYEVFIIPQYLLKRVCHVITSFCSQIRAALSQSTAKAMTYY